MIKTAFILLLLHCVSFGTSQDLKVVSWNLRDFGQSRDAGEIEMIANVIKDADIVCIQEVVAKNTGGAQAIAKLDASLDRKGANWDYRISHPTNDLNPHKRERYAFLWKTKAVNIVGKIRLIDELDHLVCREPSLASFEYNNETFSILNYHACTHDKTYPERSEIKHITNWILDNYQDDVIWCGDMNLKIDDQAFKLALNNGFTNALNGKKTSLKRSCKKGEYKSRAEDNILYKLGDFRIIASDVIDFIGNKNCNEVEWKWVSISDHLPIMLIMNLN